MSTDPLSALRGTAFCPVCGCIEKSGSVRCAECGTFHSSAHLEEREAPPPSQEIPAQVIDPAAYSLTPGSDQIPVESFEESDSITSWEGGSTDFTMDEEDERPMSRVDPDELVLPDPEELTNIK
ncbi:MAG: hypothetical protein O3B00_02440 [archaeon]|jgi:hypothetical protein|nr:hypothetical protein [archaeon]MDA1130341.1 hypothetical protein [archaeon]